MQPGTPYTDDFYKKHQEGSCQSAKEIVPLVLELVQPKSVIDVGCGVGTWLSVFKEYGVDDIVGVDGDWVDKNMLAIPEERFLSFDLKNLSEWTGNLIWLYHWKLLNTFRVNVQRYS